MKVLYFHQHFTTPALGGATRSYEFARRLIERGHTVTMVCGEMAKLNLPKTGVRNVYRGDVDGIDVIQISLPYSIGLSPGICEGIAKRSQRGKKIRMIPNGCDLNIFCPGNREDLDLPGIKSTDQVAVFTGAHGIANGLDAVVDAAIELKKMKREDIVLVFIGSGKTKARLIKRVEREGLNNCHFFDPMPKNRLNRIVASADIGMMVLANVPAFYYGTSPNKFFDYISSGLPVLNNYPGWLADMITQNHCGVVVPPEDAKAFAEALVRLADHPELRKEFGKNGRLLAEKEFDRNKLADAFVDFLEDIYAQYNS